MGPPRPRRAFLAAGYAFFVLISANNLAAPIYGLYAREFDFSPLVLTLVFSVYVAAVIPSMLIVGPVSDAFGRRAVAVPALALATAGALLFMLADSTADLFLARALQGAAIGSCSGALTAALVESRANDDSRPASVVAAVAMSAGPGIGALASGVLAEWGPWAPHLGWLLTAILLGGATIAALTLPRAGTGARRPIRLAIPTGAAGPFAAATAIAALAGAVSGLFASVVPVFVGSRLDTNDYLLLGAVTAVFCFAAGTAQIRARKTSMRGSQRLGLLLMGCGLLLLGVAGAANSAEVFLLAAAIAGAGEGLTFMGSTAAVNHLARGDRHAAIVSTYYVICYAVMALVVIGTGLLATLWDIVPAVATFAALIAVGSLVTFARMRGPVEQNALDTSPTMTPARPTASVGSGDDLSAPAVERGSEDAVAPESVHDFETLLLERDGPIVTLTLNRPERLNAMYTTLFEEFAAAFELIRRDTSMRVVVITGAGRAFCAGGDIDLDVSEVGGWSAATMLYENEIGHQMIRDVRQLPRPVIARVNGVAVGGGCDLALACDIVIASTSASFGEFWVRRGLVPGMGGAQMLPFLVGTHRAKELLFTGDRIDAATAAGIGLINRAVPPEQLDEEVSALARRLANMPTMAIGAVKKMVHSVTDGELEAQFQISAASYHLLSHTEDYKEGVAAFQERREPEFRGQ